MGRSDGPNVYIWLATAVYIVMVAILSGGVHEYVHVLQYSNVDDADVDEICFFGIREYDDNTVNVSNNNCINNFMMKVGSIGGWVKIDGEINGEYIAGLNRDEVTAYLVQGIFILILIFPMYKVWSKDVIG